MTISTTDSEVSYATDGVTTSFPIPFVFDSVDDLKVVLTDEDGNVTELTSGFSTTGGDGSTGTLVFTSAPADDHTLTIIDDPEQKQTIDYVSNDAFPAETNERGLDYLTRLVKRLARKNLRTLRTQDGDPLSGDGLILPSVTNRANRYAYFNEDGELEMAAAIDLTTLTQSIIGALLFPRTAAEIAAGVTPQDYAYPELNVLRYGADPTGVEDSTEAFQNAIDVAQAYGAFSASNLIPISDTNTPLFNGGVVYAPRGKYRIADTLLVTSMCAIKGDGPSATVIFYDISSGTLTTNDYLIQVGTSPTGTARVRPWRLQDLTLMTTDRSAAGENAPRGINLLDTHQWVIKRVNMHYLHVPIDATDSWMGRIKECFFYLNYCGSYFSAQCHNLRITDSNFVDIRATHPLVSIQTFLAIRNSWAVLIDGCDFETGDTVQGAIFITNDCRAITVQACYFEGLPNAYGIYIWDGVSGVGAQGVNVLGNLFNHAGLGGVLTRTSNPTPTHHRAIVVEANQARLDSSAYLVANASSAVPVNSWVRNNSIAVGLGEINPDAAGWKWRGSGSFEVTGTGFSDPAPTGTAYWTRDGDQVTLSIPNLSGTSNATSFTITGVPSYLQIPSRTGIHSARQMVVAVDNGASTQANARLPEGSGTISLRVGVSASDTSWTASGTKGVDSFVLAYSVNA